MPRQVVEVALALGKFGPVCLAQLLPMAHLLRLGALLHLELLLLGSLVLAWLLFA